MQTCARASTQDTCLGLFPEPVEATVCRNQSFTFTHTHTHTHPPPPPHFQVIFWICVVVWIINYPNYLTFKMLPGLPFPDPSTVVVNWSKVSLRPASCSSCTLPCLHPALHTSRLASLSD